MADQREVRILMDAAQQTQIKEVVGLFRFYGAIGYLSTWNMSYGFVQITQDDTTDMVALYKDTEDGPTKYVIGAVWHGDRYGFHS
jgi:phosphoribosylaminoimidazole (AIR) synthetase